MRINVCTEKTTKPKLRKIKTKLTSQKAHKKKMRATCKNTLIQKDAATDVIDNSCSNDKQNIVSIGEPDCSFRRQTSTQANLCKRNIHKKKYSNNEELDKSFFDQCFTNDSTKFHLEQQEKTDSSWKLSNSDEDVNDDWIQNAPKEKRNLGLPLVVDMLSDGVTSMNLPQIFQDEQSTRLEKIIHDDTFELNTLLNSSTCTTVAESVNPNCNTYVKYPKQTSLVSTSVAKNNENKKTSEKNICRRTKNSMHNELVKNEKFKSIQYNDTKTCNSKHKNVNSRRQMFSRKSLKVYCIRNIVIIIMESGSRFCFTGKLLVKVLYGAIKIYGFTLNKSTGSTEVYSPNGYSNIAVETSDEFLESSIDDIWMILATEGITRDSESKLQIDIDNVRPGMVVLVLQNFENNLTLFLKTHFPFKLFPNVKNPHYFSWTDPKRAEIILQAKLRLEQYDDFNYRSLIMDPSIVEIAERMLSRWRANEWSCTLVAGGKNVGKSTTVRCLINTLLQTSKKVVLIDVDPGQAECTPPRCISYTLIEEPLMGPNFTHLKIPVYQIFIDDVNVSRCITRYLEGIKMLIEKLRECPILCHLPIVVNTMGFTNSLGWDIAIFTIKLIRPSVILQIMSSKKKNNYDDVFSAVVVNQQEFSWTFCDESFINWNKPCEHDLCIIHSQAEIVAERTSKWNMEPYQQRELVMMSYFSGVVHDKNDSLYYNTRLPFNINEVVPYTAPFSSLCIIPQRLFGVPASRALNVINGNIVALCGIDLTNEFSQESEGICSLRVLTQRSPLCTCYGFGIIRGIDVDRQEIFIITPLPISMMQHVNCLAGCIPVPPALLQIHHGAPYVGGNAELPTSRNPRRGYFRMRYQNKSSKSQ